MLIPAVQDTNISKDDYEEDLLNVGYECIGSGSYCDVFAKDEEDTVIKIGYVYGGHPSADPYLTFLSFIDDTNPFFPRIKSIEIFKFFDVNDGNDWVIYYVVKMERLEDYHSVSVPMRVQLLKSIGLTHIDDLSSFGIVHSRTKNKNLKKAMNVLESLYDLFSEDIKQDNVMWRKSEGRWPQLVITDPVA